MEKISYFVSQLLGNLRFPRSRSCPNCGSSSSRLLARKFVVSELRLCSNCGISFRWPTDSIDTSAVIYQDCYAQSGLTTDLPGPAQLEELKKSLFKKSEKNFTSYIAFLQRFYGDQLRCKRVLDYGANWGYFLYQLEAAGVGVAYGYEVSTPRRRFGENELGVSYLNKLSETIEYFDVVLTTHVIEHVPVPSRMLQDIYNALTKGGLLVLECPNGSLCASATPRWNSQWGRIHPYYISDSYLVKALKELGFMGVVVDKAELHSISSLSLEEIMSEINVLPCSRSPVSSTLVALAIKK